MLDGAIINAINGSLGKLNKKLFFDRDQNYLTGMSRLVPPEKTITLPNGQSFAVGQYIQNNLPYLLSNSNIQIKLSKGADIKPIFGPVEGYSKIAADIFHITFNAPGINFSIKLREEYNVNWGWVCSFDNPRLQCEIP